MSGPRVRHRWSVLGSASGTQRRRGLLRDAGQQARHHGHLMWPFERLGQPGSGRWGSTCSLCGMRAWVTAEPLPNEAHLMGDALTRDCPHERA